MTTLHHAPALPSRPFRTARPLAVAALAALLALPPSLACAQAAPPTPAPAGDDAAEERLDDDLRQLGYWAGAAHQCVEEARQTEVERRVLDTFTGISRLFGSDRAFFFAAAFGRGTVEERVDKAKCGEFLKRFQDATSRRGFRTGGGQ